MDNPRVAEVLESIALLLELQDENPFKVRAYQNAARTLESSAEDVCLLVKQKRLDAVPGIGEALREKITELVTTGRLEYFEKLRAAVPPGVVDLLSVPSLGPKKARLLWKELGIESLDGLRKACEENRLLDVKGFGEKTQAKLLAGLGFLEKNQGRHLLSEALPCARRLLAHLQKSPDVIRSEIAGSLRRWKELVHDVDLLVSSTNAPAVMEHFVRAAGVHDVIGRGDTKTSVRLENGLQVDLRVVRDDQYPCALNYFTGSKEHNVSLRQIAQAKGLKLSEYSLGRGSTIIETTDEPALYRALDLPYIPPELREGPAPPKADRQVYLIERQSLKGTFHSHSSWSDGIHSIEAMAEKARAMGLTYLGLSDHSAAASYARGLDEGRLEQQGQEIDRLNRRWTDFRILKGLECDILPDGSLDLTPEALGSLDFVIGSVHSRYDMPKEEMTRRICTALANEHLDMLGHPTGRLLLSREAYAVDLDQVIEAARKHDKIIELNAFPNRLDLDVAHCRRAQQQGVLLSINPDAHSTDDLENLDYGIGCARRAGLEPKDVLNTQDLGQVLETLGRRA